MWYGRRRHDRWGRPGRPPRGRCRWPRDRSGRACPVRTPRARQGRWAPGLRPRPARGWTGARRRPFALGRLLQEQRSWLWRQARRLWPRRLDPKLSPSDLVQGVNQAAARDIDRYRGRSKPSFRAWLRRILVRVRSQALRNLTADKRDVDREEPLPGDSARGIRAPRGPDSRRGPGRPRRARRVDGPRPGLPRGPGPAAPPLALPRRSDVRAGRRPAQRERRHLTPAGPSPARAARTGDPTPDLGGQAALGADPEPGDRPVVPAGLVAAAGRTGSWTFPRPRSGRGSWASPSAFATPPTWRPRRELPLPRQAGGLASR